MWMTIDMADIRLCQDLMAQLEIEYSNEDRTAIVHTTPEKIFQTTSIALWARCDTGTKEINLGLPSLKAWLDNLAMCGPGRGEWYEGVTYKFVKRELLHFVIRRTVADGYYRLASKRNHYPRVEPELRDRSHHRSEYRPLPCYKFHIRAQEFCRDHT